jgi:hypothetical protein
MKRSLYLIILAFVFSLPSLFGNNCSTPIISYSFDWDDNVFNMPTKIVLFHKKSGKELSISTAEFALVRQQIGKNGKYEMYEIRDDLKKGSLRYVADEMGDGVNHFLKDIKDGTKTDTVKDSWKGPSWDMFVSIMENPETAKEASIITARHHKPETIYEALMYLKEQGYIKNVIPVENIWTVNNSGFAKKFEKTFGFPAVESSAVNPSAAKLSVLEQNLDRISKVRISDNSPEILKPEGRGLGKYHLFAFSDDDLGNIEKAQNVLSEGISKDKWKNVKISLFYTGTKTPGTPPKAIVLSKSKNPRVLTEENESKELFKRIRDLKPVCN